MKPLSFDNITATNRSHDFSNTYTNTALFQIMAREEERAEVKNGEKKNTRDTKLIASLRLWKSVLAICSECTRRIYRGIDFRMDLAGRYARSRAVCGCCTRRRARREEHRREWKMRGKKNYGKGRGVNNETRIIIVAWHRVVMSRHFVFATIVQSVARITISAGVKNNPNYHFGMYIGKKKKANYHFGRDRRRRRHITESPVYAGGAAGRTRD